MNTEKKWTKDKHNDYELLALGSDGKLYAVIDSENGYYQRLTLRDKIKIIFGL